MQRKRRKTETKCQLLNTNNPRQKEIGEYLTFNELAKLARTSREKNNLFQPVIDEAKEARALLKAVVEGNPAKLALVVEEKPHLLFTKSTVNRRKSYALALRTRETRIEPGILYLQTTGDGCLEYTVSCRPTEINGSVIDLPGDYLLQANIDALSLHQMGIRRLPNRLTLNDLETIIRPRLNQILEITSSRYHTLTLEQKFKNVSAYQLMIFLCDTDMKRAIMPLLTSMTEKMTVARKEQDAELLIGGADLVKMDRDPSQLSFEELTQFRKSYMLNGQSTEINFPLLENPDGLIYYKNTSTREDFLYYVNQKTKTIELMTPQYHTLEENMAVAGLYFSLAEMEDNSGRRSSNEEHRIIAQSMGKKLVRKGIQYEQNGVDYCNNRIEFRLINNYREYIRTNNGQNDWYRRQRICYQLSSTQLDVMWLLQRLCYTENQATAPFNRQFISESVCRANEYINNGLGLHFSMINYSKVSTNPQSMLIQHTIEDFIAINEKIQEAKATLIEAPEDNELNESHRAAPR